MAQVYTLLWMFVTAPHVCLSVLSDYKVCGGSGCESPMSRVRAIRDHQGRDCRFLSFRRGESISVYHKLSGQREDLWAGTIDKQFGYFPKDAVQVEQVYTTKEKVVETQRSDFFCMDESGYPIDFSDMGSDDQAEDQKTLIQEVESNTDVEPNAADQVSDGASTEDTGRGDKTLDEDSPAPSNSWFGSTVKGLLGLGKQEESTDLTAEEKDEAAQTESIASSVTGWLGFGGQGTSKDEDDKEKVDSLSSSVTEKKTGSIETDSDGIRMVEPDVTFRSRRMSLDLEGSQLHEEEERDVQSLDWPGNGLFGFGASNKEMTAEREETDEEEDQSAPGSWFGIGNILGFGNVEKEKEVRGGEDKETDKNVEEQNVDTKETQVETEPEDKRVEEHLKMNESATSALTETDDKENDAASKFNRKHISQNKTEMGNSDPAKTEGELPDAKSENGDNMEPLSEDIIANDTNVDYLTAPDTEHDADFSSMDKKSNSVAQSGDKGDNQQFSAKEEEPEIDVGEAREDEMEATHEDAPVTESDDSAQQVRVSGIAEKNSFSSSDTKERKDPVISETLKEREHKARKSDEVREMEEKREEGMEEKEKEDKPEGVEGKEKEETGENQEGMEGKEKEETGGKQEGVEGREKDREEKQDGMEGKEKEERDEKKEGMEGKEKEKKQAGVEGKEGEEKKEGVEGKEKEEKQEGMEGKEKQKGMGWKEKEGMEEKQEGMEEQHGSKEKQEEGKQEEMKLDKEKVRCAKQEVVEELSKEKGTEEEEKLREMEEIEVNAEVKEKGAEEMEIQQEEVVEERKEALNRVQVKGIVGEEDKEELEEEKKIETEKVKEERSKEKADALKEIEKSKEEEDKHQNGKDMNKETEQEEADVPKEGEVREDVEEAEEEKEAQELKEKCEEVEEKVVGVEGEERQGEGTEELKEEDKLKEERGQEDVEEKREMKDAKDVEVLKGEGGKERQGEVVELKVEEKLEEETKEEKKQEENEMETQGGELKEGEEIEEVIGRKQEVESSPCLNELCPQATKVDSVMSRDKNISEDQVQTGSDISHILELQNKDSEARLDKHTGEATEDLNLNTGYSERADLQQENDTEPEDRKNPDSAPLSVSDHMTAVDGGTERSDLQLNESIETLERASEEASGSSLSPDDRSASTPVGGEGGALGLLGNALGFFRLTPVTDTKDDADSETNTGGTSPPHVTHISDREVDSKTDGSPHDPLVTMATDQLQASPQSPSPLPPIQPLSKHHTNLLLYMSADEATVLTELFGRHKLQFLDYMLMPEEHNADESILTDIERQLRHHMEMLTAPSMRLSAAPHEDKERTRALIALQKLEMLIARVRDMAGTVEVAESAEAGREESAEDGAREAQEVHVIMGDSIRRDDGIDEGSDRKERNEEREANDERGNNESESPQSQEGVIEKILDIVGQTGEESSAHAVMELIMRSAQVVSSLPDDMRPGPDLYGVPWEPVVFTTLLGLVIILLFTCRCYSSVKSRLYRSKERRLAAQVAELLDEKCKVLETLSQSQQEYDELEDSLRDSGVLAQTQKTEHLEIKARQLEDVKNELEMDLEQLKDQLDLQKQDRIEQARRIEMLEESMKTFEEESKELQSQEEQAQTTLKVYNMNSDRLQRNLETAGEENTLLQESNAQLRQQVEGWAERVNELEAEMERYEVAYSGMQQGVANKDERIMSLTDCLLTMKAWDSEPEEEDGTEKDTSNRVSVKGEKNGRDDATDTQDHYQKVQKLIYAAKLNADLKSVNEDKDRVFAKLNDEVKAKEDLTVSIQELENEKSSLQVDSEHYTEQVQRLQQKLHIMTEMYQENELKLHRLLTVEEKERLQKEEKLNKADKNIALAMEELNNYRQRAGEMEDELDKSKQSYQTQISAHEKKAHNNWLAARSAERDLADIRRENALLRHKLTDTQFKLDALDKDPYALNSLARPMPFRAERSPYGPSPLGRPASETRAFLSPPTLMDGPPLRLSPRVGRGPMDPPGGHGEMERSGGPHSDSGSISPTWERDRRGPPPGPLPGPPGPPGPPGYMFAEPGGPMYRRPPPPPGAMGLMAGPLPPGPLPPGLPPPHLRGFPPAGPPGPPHPLDLPDGSFKENSLGPGELEHRESRPGDRRTPPDVDPRMGGPPPLGAPMGPMDGPFPRRGPYGPPPPDFYPPRGPGGPPMLPRWAPPPPGVSFPPRFPPGGLPPPHYAAPMRQPPPEGLHPASMGPPQQNLPSPPHSQSPEERRPSPEDAI